MQVTLEQDQSTISTVVKTQIQRQRDFFKSGKTKDLEFRLTQLKALRRVTIEYTDAIVAALKADLGKPEFEAVAAEVGVVREIDHAIKHLKKWMKPQRAGITTEQLPATAFVQPEPYGVALIIGAWNYPVQLSIAPLIGAIAAGNCALLKPSEYAPHASQVLAEMFAKTFDPGYISVIEGGIEVSQVLLQEKFDYIFFTGGTAIGRIVMAAAAQHLTPVTLELGGKSPCIVDADTHLEHTARRIVWGKFLNVGQTCIAPDYLLVDRRVKPALVEALKNTLRDFYGDDPANNPDLGRIVNAKQFDRIVTYLNQGEVILGGQHDATQRYIAPTLLDHVSWDAPVMQEEIFGPILPIMEYDTVSEAIDRINAKPKPLALYLFSRDQKLQDQVLQNTSSGGVCINDVIVHCGSATLPFGGVGDSGMGSYHGKASFDAFSHHKSVLRRSLRFDPPWRYAPYSAKQLKLVKQLLGIKQ